LEDVKLLNFADFIFNSYNEEIEEMTEELKQAGINTNKCQEKILKFLSNKKAELHLKKERKFRADYMKLLAYLSLSQPKLEIDIIKDKSRALAYRKKMDEADEPTDEAARKLELIKRA